MKLLLLPDRAHLARVSIGRRSHEVTQKYKYKSNHILKWWRTSNSQQVSSPYLRRNIALMERIQRLATRMVKGMRELPYEDRLRRLNIFSLERRRLRGDLILAYNILHGRLDLPQASFFEAPVERGLRGHDHKLRHRSFRLLWRKAAFSVRLPISWNKLSMEIVNSPTLDTLKWLLDLAWFSLFHSLPWLLCSLNFYFTWFEVPTSAVVFDQPIWFDLNNKKTSNMKKVCDLWYIHCVNNDNIQKLF